MTIRIGRDKILIFAFFIGAILLGAGILVIPGVYTGGRLSLVDALFTATSAVCVTGLITVDTAQFSLAGQVVIMSLIQIGGLGIITFATLFLAMPRRRLSIVSNVVIGDYTLPEVEYRPKTVLKAIIKYTLAFEFLGFVFYALRFRSLGIPLFSALFHAVSSFCNAGFSTFPNSLESFVFDPIINFTTMGLILIGGIGFIVIKDLRNLMTRKSTHLSYHSRVVLTTSALLVAAGTIVFFILEQDAAMRGFTLSQKFMASLFQSVTPRTAGFDTIAQGRLSQGSHLLTMLLMFIGASPASTGGGVKTTSFFVLVMTAFRYRESSDNIHFQGRTIPPRTVAKAVGVVVKGIFIILAVSIMVMVAERNFGNSLTLVDSIFETISAFGTVGLSLGVTASLTGFSKILLILTMFIGRVGLFAFALPKPERDVEGYAVLPTADIMI